MGARVLRVPKFFRDARANAREQAQCRSMCGGGKAKCDAETCRGMVDLVSLSVCQRAEQQENDAQRQLLHAVLSGEGKPLIGTESTNVAAELLSENYPRQLLRMIRAAARELLS